MRGDPNRHGMRGWPRKKGEGDRHPVGLLLPERARSECARSTAAVRLDTGAVLRGRPSEESLEGLITLGVVLVRRDMVGSVKEVGLGLNPGRS